MVVRTADDVDGLLCTTGLLEEISKVAGHEKTPSPCRVTYTKLNWYREELGSSSLSNRVTTRDTGEVDVARLDNALLALGGLDDLFGESVCGQAVSCQSRAIRNVPISGVGHGKGG